MKKTLTAFLLFCSVACAQQTDEKNQPPVSVEKVKTDTLCNFCTVSPQEFNNRTQNEPGQLVDVRTPGEVANGKLKGSVNYDYNGSDFKNQMQKIDKNTTVYVYCAGGGRSAKAMEWMKTNGFVSVVNLDGGINSWIENQLPVE
ncbi:MAG: rhodanese-like domain-containing protein [Flavobacteriales bacterium]